MHYETRYINCVLELGEIKATMLVRDVHTYFMGGGSKFLGKREDGDAYLSDGGLFYLNRVRMRLDAPGLTL